MAEQLVIGVDCATSETKNGLALGRVTAGRLVVEEVVKASARRPTVLILSEWLRQRRNANVLLALDAPLGWPRAFGVVFNGHRAGERVSEEDRDRPFGRLTDHQIEARLGKKPLEVGANLIARAAHASLERLSQLRNSTRLPIPMAWSSEDGLSGVCAIEVYPAATRVALGVTDKGGSLDGLDGEFELADGVRHESKDERDAIVCAIAGNHFLHGLAVSPTPSEIEDAEIEGWIWVRHKMEHSPGGQT